MLLLLVELLLDELSVDSELSDVLENELVLLISAVELELLLNVLRLVLTKPVELLLELDDLVDSLLLELVEAVEPVLEVLALDVDLRNVELELVLELEELVLLELELNDSLESVWLLNEVRELVLPPARVLLEERVLTLEVLLATSVL